MNDLIWIAGFGLSAFLIIYHHVGFEMLRIEIFHQLFRQGCFS